MVLAKGFMPKIKEMFASAGDSSDAAGVNEEQT